MHKGVHQALAVIKRTWLTGLSPVWCLYLRLRGVTVAGRLVVIGRPGIQRKRGSSIILGDGVTLCSSGMANPVAEGGRCRLATLAAGACIEIEAGAGLSSAIVACAQSVTIGADTLVGGGAVILDTDFHPRRADGSWGTDPLAVSAPVRIGRSCFIGTRAIILKGVTIGDGAVVGAGAVVARDIPAGATVIGNPARVVGAAAF